MGIKERKLLFSLLISSVSRDISLLPTLMSSVVETSHIKYSTLCLKKDRPALRGLCERSTEPWGVFGWRFSYLVIYVDKMNFNIHMSS